MSASPLPDTLASFVKCTKPPTTEDRAAAIAKAHTLMRSEGVRRLIASGLTIEVGPPVLKSELQFVFEATTKTRWPFQDASHPIGWDDWVHIFGPRVTEMIRDGRALVASASHEGTRVILGFALWEAFDVLAMIYVKHPFRGTGIGIKLLETSGVELPLKALGETTQWRKWVKLYGIPTVRVEESELAKWKGDAAQVERRMSLGRTAFDREMFPAAAEGADE